MRIWHAAVVSVLLGLGFPSIAQQEEGRPYFSLSSNRTFGPGERPVIQLWAQGVDTLQFRVYRVKDPVAFFGQLEDEHQFGGQAPRTPRALTPIERFHRWKVNARIWMRSVFRRQFRQESRAAIRDWLAAREQKPAPAPAQPTTEFANVPLLNPQQVVSVWQQRISRRNRWDSQVVPINVTEKGLYLVEVTDGRLQAYTIVSVTELAIITKGAPGRILARVVHRLSGSPVANCPVLVRLKSRELTRLRADVEGMIEVKPAEAPLESVLVMARDGEDFAVDSMYGWNLANDPERSLAGYVYTDRPVYRPGHTVHFRGILRAQSGSGYRLPERKEVEVQVEDSDGKQVFRRTLPISAMGTLHSGFTLPPAAALGYYGIEVRAGEAQMNGGFQVEEYKKPEYEVRVTPEKRRALQTEPVAAAIEARYYYGEPVAQAKVTYVVHRARYWLPYYALEEEDPEEEEAEDRYGAGEQVLEGSGQLDAQGKLAIRIPTEQRTNDLRYRIEARVTDSANREIAGAGSVVATIGNYFVRIQPDRWLYSPGEKARLKVEARDYDGKPAGEIGFRVELTERRWQQPPGPVLASVEGRTDAGGNATVELPLTTGGSFTARVISRTPEGREVADTAQVWVSGGESWSWARRQRVEVVPDKKSYRPGETAKVLIVTGLPEAHLWVTTEGRGVYTSRLVTANGPTLTVEVPILPEYSPNFFLTAVFLRGNQLYRGSKSITAPPLERQLSVEMKSSKAEYRPGENGLFTLEARDYSGRPVSAEFSLGVVDEAIYAIRRETVQDILKFFYGRGGNQVSTDSSLSYYFHGEAGKRRMQLARVRPLGPLAQLKPERLIEPNVRKAFPDTIYWVADLRTDASGRAQAQVTFPDALTTWRATARGVTADTKVGSAVHKTVVRKNLILRLAVPRFFTEGDELVIPALVHNYLASEKQVRVSLATQGLNLIEGGTRDVTVASKGQAQVDFRVRAPAAGQAVLLGKALTGQESDALELTLPILPYGVKLALAKAGSLAQPQAQTEIELEFPPEAAPNSRTLELGVTPSLAGAVFGALEYLTSFPYGCTEQTMSSFLPNVVVAQAVKDLGLSSGVDAAQLDKKIRAGLERLYEFQHEDGGWGWWKTDESQAFMTAYVLAGLERARAAGYKLREDVTGRAAGWLRAQLPQMRRESADLRAYVVHSLVEAGLKESAWLDGLWAERSALTPYGLALMGLAMQRAGDARADAVAGLLESAAKSDETEAFWQVDRDSLMDIFLDATPEATAYALKFLTRQRPQSPLLAKAALYLVNHRNQGYYWTSTKQTAMVIYGLTDYLGKSGELRPNYGVTVWVNDREVLSRRFGEADALAPAPAPIRLPAGQLAAAKNRIRIRKSGEGRLYWSARGEYYSTAGRLAGTGSVSLNLLREYFKLTPSEEGGKIVYRLDPLAGTVERGDVLAVRLTVSGGSWRYLMVEDPIPAGAEFIQRDDLYELKEKPPWWASWYTRREFHDDRAAIFQTFFQAGQSQYFYLLKVVNPGKFRVSPARVQPMYQPQFLATTESRTMEVK